MVTADNGIFVTDKAKERLLELMKEAGHQGPSWFVRVGVVGGGCSGLSYKLDFDNEVKPGDQVFEDKGISFTRGSLLLT